MSNAFKNFIIILVSGWIILASLQIRQLSSDSHQQNQLINNKLQANSLNQAILLAYSNYKLNHNIQATIYWLNIAQNNITATTPKKCVHSINICLQQLEQLNNPTQSKHLIKTKLKQIIQAYTNTKHPSKNLLSINQLSQNYSIQTIIHNNQPTSTDLILEQLNTLNNNLGNLNHHQINYQLTKILKLTQASTKAYMLSLANQIQSILTQTTQQNITIDTLNHCNIELKTITYNKQPIKFATTGTI